MTEVIHKILNEMKKEKMPENMEKAYLSPEVSVSTVMAEKGFAASLDNLYEDSEDIPW